MYNILEAICNIAAAQDLFVDNIKSGNNRANNMGEGLEGFVKNAFANSLNEEDEVLKIKKYAAAFSWEGSRTRIPDLILKNSDAIEIKKVESTQIDLQLNSSHPKATLKADSPALKKECLDCETPKWVEKDLLYVIGHIPKKSKNLASIWLVYGDIYAASAASYTDVENIITDSIEQLNLGFSKTKELGRVNHVDPLKITNLRIRGMWMITPPKKVFSYIYNYNPNAIFQLVAIMTCSKYDSFPKESREKIEAAATIEIKDIEIKNPNNPVQLIAGKLITIIKK